MPTPSLLKIVFLLKGIEKGFSATTTQLKVENIILIDKSSFLSAGLISFFLFFVFLGLVALLLPSAHTFVFNDARWI